MGAQSSGPVLDFTVESYDPAKQERHNQPGNDLQFWKGGPDKKEVKSVHVPQLQCLRGGNVSGGEKFPRDQKLISSPGLGNRKAGHCVRYRTLT
jgi:hypothetical protein